MIPGISGFFFFFFAYSFWLYETGLSVIGLIGKNDV